MNSAFDGCKNMIISASDVPDLSNVITMDGMLNDVHLTIDNYDALLNAWSKLTLQENVTFDAPECYYSDVARDARNAIINKYSWKIKDQGLVHFASTIKNFSSGNIITIYPENVSKANKSIFSKDSKSFYEKLIGDW